MQYTSNNFQTLNKKQSIEAKQLIMQMVICGVEEPKKELCAIHNLLKVENKLFKNEKKSEASNDIFDILVPLKEIILSRESDYKDVLSQILCGAAGENEIDRAEILLSLDQLHVQITCIKSSSIKTLVQSRVKKIFDTQLAAKGFFSDRIIFNSYTNLLNKEEKLPTLLLTYQKSFESDSEYPEYEVKDMSLIEKDPIIQAFACVALTMRRVYPFFMYFPHALDIACLLYLPISSYVSFKRYVLIY